MGHTGTGLTTNMGHTGTGPRGSSNAPPELNPILGPGPGFGPAAVAEWKRIQKGVVIPIQTQMAEQEIMAADMCKKAGITEKLWGKYCACRLPMRVEHLVATSLAVGLQAPVLTFSPS